MLGPSEKPDGCDGIFTLNQGFKGYSLRRHLGDLLFRPLRQRLMFQQGGKRMNPNQLNKLSDWGA